MTPKYFWIFLFLPLTLWCQSLQKLGTFEPYFSYSAQELKALGSLPVSTEPLTQQTFERWDSIVYKLTSDPKPDGITMRLMAYLYNAQRDFALLSYATSKQWVGNPDELIVKVLNLCYSNVQTSDSKTDSYSSALSNLVFKKIEERFNYEQAHLKNYPERKGPRFWKEEAPVIGQRTGSCQPWLLNSIFGLDAESPPSYSSIIWAYGINLIKQEQANLTPQQRDLIYWWASKLGPESGNWFAIANQDLHQKQLPLLDYLLVRSGLAMSITNALIACFHSKYTYWVLRPHMRNPDIIQVINCPKHPSYPSGHSVTAAAAATVLSHFFPQERQKWENLAFESGNSRIWGGLHFMYDNEQGLIQGQKVALATIKYLPSLYSTNKEKLSAKTMESTYQAR